MARTLRILLLPLVLLLALAGVTAPAFATTTTWLYSAASGGTYVKLASGLVTSDMTSKSGITGTAVPASNKNSVATVNVSGVVSTGAVSTSNAASAVTGGTRVLTTAQTAGVNVLNGLIRADAITSTIDTLLKPDGTSTATGSTNFVNLRIAGVTLPLNLPKNYVVSVPGVARVSLNYFATGESKGQRTNIGWAIAVELLTAQGNLPAGATISINPEFQTFAPAPPSDGALLTGEMYGTRIKAQVSDTAEVESPATARLTTPLDGSDGATLTNTTAGVDLPAVLTVGAVKSTSTSTRSGTYNQNGDIVNTNEVAGVNLLNGLVKLDALKVATHSRRVDGVCSSSVSFSVVNLSVGGKVIPVTVSPNTVIDVAGIATVTINGQYKNGCQAAVRGIKVVLTTAQAGLPVGAVAEVGFATSHIRSIS